MKGGVVLSAKYNNNSLSELVSVEVNTGIDNEIRSIKTEIDRQLQFRPYSQSFDSLRDLQNRLQNLLQKRTTRLDSNRINRNIVVPVKRVLSLGISVGALEGEKRVLINKLEMRTKSLSKKKMFNIMKKAKKKIENINKILKKLNSIKIMNLDNDLSYDSNIILSETGMEHELNTFRNNVNAFILGVRNLGGNNISYNALYGSFLK